MSQYLQETAAVAGADPAVGKDMRAMFDRLGQYQALVAQVMLIEDDSTASPGRPPARALGLYRQATDLMRQQILPTAGSLSKDNDDILNGSYEDSRSSVLAARSWVGIFGGLAILALVVTHIYLSRRHHRFLNPALLGTTLAMAALVGLSFGLLSSEAEHLRVAKKDDFDSIFALTQARAVSYDANADESRYLIDPDRAAQYEQAFLGKSQKLAGFDGVGITQYNSALKGAIAAYAAHHHDVGFIGFFGMGLRNITFPGERAAAERTIAAFQVYQQDDAQIRALLTSGNIEEAIRFSTSTNPGDSNYAFNQYDDALSAWIGVNQKAFDGAIRTGERELGGWSVIPGIGALLAIALLLLGSRPRLAEYR